MEQNVKILFPSPNLGLSLKLSLVLDIKNPLAHVSVP